MKNFRIPNWGIIVTIICFIGKPFWEHYVNGDPSRMTFQYWIHWLLTFLMLGAILFSAGFFFKWGFDKAKYKTDSINNKNDSNIFIVLVTLEIITIGFFCYCFYNNYMTKREVFKMVAIGKETNDRLITMEKQKIEKENTRIEQKKLKCNKAFYEACIEIYRTVYGYNRVFKINNQQLALKFTKDLFSINSDQLEKARNDYFEVIDSNRLYAIDDALKSLKYLSEDIINSQNRKKILYSNICKIDSSFESR